jgi:hypothetical protein
MAAQPSLFPVSPTSNNTPCSMRLPQTASDSVANTVTLINLDSTNTVTINGTNSVTVGGNGIALGPGASIQLPTSSPWFAVAPLNTSPMLVAPGAANYTSPTLITGPVTISGTVTVGGTVAISGTVPVSIGGTVAVSITGANTIQVTGNVNVVGTGGTFPAGGSTLLANASAQVVPAGGALTVNMGDMSTYTAYNLSAQAYCTTQGTVGAPLTVQVLLKWYADAAYSQQVDSDTGHMWVSNAAGVTQTLYVKGPTQGRYLQLQFYNPDGTTALDVNYFFYGTGRELGGSSHWWQKAPLGGAMTAGQTMLLGAGVSPASGSDDNILSLIANQAIAASTTMWQPLPLKSPCLSDWEFQTLVALANNLTLNMGARLINGSIIAGTGAPGAIWNPGNTAATPFSAQFSLPRCPMWFCAHTTATATTLSMIAMASDVS